MRDEKPTLKLRAIKQILESKMKRKPRKDIFADYENRPGLPPLDAEIGSLNDKEFELVLENVADKLIFIPHRGHWRHLGGHLGFSTRRLYSIEEKGRLQTFRSSARIFIDFLGSRGFKVKEVVNALQSEYVMRIDMKKDLEKHLEADNCFDRSCAMVEANTN